MKNQARYAIGMTVLSMKGRLENEWNDYFDVKAIFDDWKIHKRYWSTKKNYKMYSETTMFGSTREEIIDTWLDVGFAVERRFEALVKSLSHTARH